MTLLEVPMRNRMGYTQQKVWAISRLFPGVHQQIPASQSIGNLAVRSTGKNGDLKSESDTGESVLVPTSAGESQEEPALLLLSSRACEDRLKTEQHQGVRNEAPAQVSGQNQPKSSQSHSKHMCISEGAASPVIWNTPAATYLTVTSRHTQDTLPISSFAHPNTGHRSEVPGRAIHCQLYSILKALGQHNSQRPFCQESQW